ncbi:MAG TPA: hypothetical protein VGT08_21585 [Terracidiphilus sp.]|nr:hypothetical protein [Terracidiphilus sp.]
MKLKLKPAHVVVAIKLLHTAVWLFFVVCIVVVPIAAGLHRFKLAAVLAGLVLLECLVLVLNRWRCPLTDLAARFTPELTDNFDIYLPNWLARHNKTIFSVIFVVGGLFALGEWLMSNR